MAFEFEHGMKIQRDVFRYWGVKWWETKLKEENSWENVLDYYIIQLNQWIP